MDTLTETKPAVILTDLPVAPQAPITWPQYDPAIDEFVMTGPDGVEIFGQTSGQCLARYYEALRINRDHETNNGWDCLQCGLRQPAWAGDCLDCETDTDKGADHD